MADTPPRGLPPTPAAPSWPPTPPTAPRPPSRGLAAAALAVAAIALIVAFVGWHRPAPPTPPSEPTFSDQEIEAARTRACDAFDLVQRGVRLQTSAGEQGGVSNEPTMAEAQAANARLSINSGGWYLRYSLEPATPPALRAGIEYLSDVLLRVGVNYLAGAKDADPEMARLLNEGESAFQRVEELCR